METITVDLSITELQRGIAGSQSKQQNPFQATQPPAQQQTNDANKSTDVKKSP